MRHRIARALLGLAIVGSWTALTAGPAHSQCAGASTRINGAAYPIARVAAGSILTVEGQSWATGCNDTPGPCQHGGVSGPVRGITIGFVKESVGPGASLGPPIVTVDAGSDYAFVTTIAAPSTPGQYLLISVAASGLQAPPVSVVVTR